MANKKITKKKVAEILNILDEIYPFDEKCFLDYEKPWQLLIATILSAQCTDERVNQVTAKLFIKYPSLEAFAAADFTDMCEDVRSTGFFRMKAHNIIESAKILLSTYDGQLPSDMESLTALPGVGRKTANVVRGHIFKIPSITVDTHVKRVSLRFGITTCTDPEKAEFELMKILPESHWIAYNQQVITHGRQICSSQNPKCHICPFKHLCASAAKLCKNKFFF